MTFPALRVGSIRHEASLETAFEAPRTIAEILRVFAEATSDPQNQNLISALRQWSSNCVAEDRASSRNAFASLNSAEQSILRSRFGSQIEALSSLASESDPNLFAEGILAMAASASRAGDDLTAAVLYDIISRDSGPLGTRIGAAFRERAASEARALRGEGSFGRRFEYLARGFARQAADPTMIAGMGVGSLMAGAVRLGVLSRLASSGTANFLTRGYGATLLAGTAAWAAEVPAFWMTTRALHSASSSTPLAWDRATLTRELASTALMLGLLKVGGAASEGLFYRVHGLSPASLNVARLSPMTRLSQPLFTQAGMLASLYTDHLIEERLGWRPQSNSTTRILDSFATLAQFHVGGRLAAEALGPRYALATRELELRTRSLQNTALRPEQPRLPLFPPEGLALEPALAGTGTGRLLPSESEPWRDLIVQMAELKPERARRTRGRQATLEREPGQAPISPPAAEKSGETHRPLEVLEENVLQAFLAAEAKAVDRLTKNLYERGLLAPLALELEAEGHRPGLSRSDFQRAREALRTLEQDFGSYLLERRDAVAFDRRWESFQRWQNELRPPGMEGLIRLQQMTKRLGIPDVFSYLGEGIKVKARVRNNQDSAEYFHDLSLLRDFLKARGFNRVDMDNPNGRFLSHLLLNGDGNCVTLSLLFAHLAVLTGRNLQVGLLPRHVYLLGREGAVIESVLDFGLTVSTPYKSRAAAPEQKTLGAHSLLAVHLLNLGKGTLDRSQWDLAQTAFERSSAMLPNSPRPALHLGQLAQRQGRFADALQHYRYVHSLYPSDANGLNNLRMRAWERFAAGQYSEALAGFQKLNRLSPDDLDVFQGMKECYQRLGMRREAEHMSDLIELMSLDDVELE